MLLASRKSRRVEKDRASVLNSEAISLQWQACSNILGGGEWEGTTSKNLPISLVPTSADSSFYEAAVFVYNACTSSPIFYYF